MAAAVASNSTVANGSSSAAEVLHPSILWAETKKFVFITIELQDVNDLKVNLGEKSLDFEGEADGRKYEFKLDFPQEINKEESKYNKERNVQVKLVKKEAQRWRCLTTGGKKPHWIKCDWAKWVDSDDEEEGMGMNFKDFDMGSLGFGGGDDMNAMDGMDDSDDETDLPDLDGAPPPGEDENENENGTTEKEAE